MPPCLLSVWKKIGMVPWCFRYNFIDKDGAAVTLRPCRVLKPVQLSVPHVHLSRKQWAHSCGESCRPEMTPSLARMAGSFQRGHDM